MPSEDELMAGRYKHHDLPTPTKQGLYDPRFERAACGVGLVASIKGVRSHDIITKGLEVLINLGHRGACGADPETGDGAGVLVQMPHEFFSREAGRLGIGLPARGDYGVGVVFLPRDAKERAACGQVQVCSSRRCRLLKVS